MAVSFVDTLTKKTRIDPIWGGLTALTWGGMANGFSNGSTTGATYRMRITERIAGYSHRFTFSNFANTGSGSPEASATNDITVKAVIITALTNGHVVPLTFNGAATVTIRPDGVVLSDPVDIDVPQGTVMYAVTYVSVASAGQKWPQTAYGLAGRNEGNAATDVTANPIAGITNANAYVYGPSGSYGIPAKGARATKLALIGDSISRGASQTGDTDGLHLVAPLKDTSVVAIGAFGETGSAFSAIGGHWRRTPYIAGCDSWVEMYGANDVKIPNRTFASVASTRYAIWLALFNRMGQGVAATTTPNTTSTDNWATTGNQTHVADPYSNAVRVAVNDWIRDGAPAVAGVPVSAGSTDPAAIRSGAANHPLKGYLDFGDATESARNSGLWKAGMTYDGIHPSPTGYAAMAGVPGWAVAIPEIA